MRTLGRLAQAAGRRFMKRRVMCGFVRASNRKRKNDDLFGFVEL